MVTGSTARETTIGDDVGCIQGSLINMMKYATVWRGIWLSIDPVHDLELEPASVYAELQFSQHFMIENHRG